jgi:hypothetical protein
MEDSERWFTPEELAEMSRPTMDRVIEAIDAGDLEQAKLLCRAMKHEWRFLHDLMVESVLGLVDYVKRNVGEDAVADAWRQSMERGWKRDTAVIVDRDRRKVVEALAATWRAHSTSGVGPDAGRFTVEEDDEKFTFALGPCGSGGRLVRLGRYEGENAYSTTDQAHDWSFNRENMPLYCTHCTFMNESLPIEWYGAPLYPLDPPIDYHRDPCRWYWYKDPADIPARFWERYGMTKPPAESTAEAAP